MVFLIWKNADKWYEKTKRKFTYNPNTQRKALWILCTCSSKLLIWGHLWKEEERKNRHPCMLLLRVNWWWPFGGKLCRVFGNLKKYVYFNAPILWFLLRVPWTARRSNQSILKEINPEYSLKRLMLKLKLQYFGHLIWRTDSLEKTLMRERLKVGGEGDNRGWDEMVGWHHPLDGHEFEQALGVGDGLGSLACCSPRGRKESDVIEWLNWSLAQQFCL